MRNIPCNIIVHLLFTIIYNCFNAGLVEVTSLFARQSADEQTSVTALAFQIMERRVQSMSHHYSLAAGFRLDGRHD